jgi:hypothetical protein
MGIKNTEFYVDFKLVILVLFNLKKSCKEKRGKKEQVKIRIQICLHFLVKAFFMRKKLNIFKT